MKSLVVAYSLALSLLACTSETPAKVSAAEEDAAALGNPPPGKPTSKPAAPKSAKAATPAAAEEAAKPSPIDKYAHVDAAGAAKLIADEAALVILDVRTPNEFRRGHLKGAINVDITMSSFQKKIAAMDTKAHYLVHCQSGKRSTSAMHKLAACDFVKVTHLDGGYADWVKAGNPVEK